MSPKPDSRSRVNARFTLASGKPPALRALTVFCMVVAFGGLLAFLLVEAVSDPWFTRPPKPSGDGLEYENLAYHLSQGRGFTVNNQDPQWRAVYLSASTPGDSADQDEQDYSFHLNARPRMMPSTGRPPLYPLQIAALYGCFGRGPWGFAAERVLSMIWLAGTGALAAAFTAMISHSLLQKAKPHIYWLGVLTSVAVTALLLGSNRTLKSYAYDFLTEPLALFLTQLFLTLFLWLAYCSFNNAQAETGHSHLLWRLRLSLGVVLGCMILARSVFVLWLPFLWILGLCLPAANARARIGQTTWIVVVACLVCLPWWTRNVMVLQAFRPLGTQGPITLLGGYSDAALAAGGEWQHQPEQQLRSAAAQTPEWLDLPDDSQRELWLAQRAGSEVRQWIGVHWSELPGMFFQRIVTHWNPYTGRALAWKLAALAGLAWMITSVLQSRTAAGSVSAPLNAGVSCGLCLALGFAVISTLVTGIIYSVGGRFLVPLYGLLSSLAGLGVAGMLCLAVAKIPLLARGGR